MPSISSQVCLAAFFITTMGSAKKTETQKILNSNVPSASPCSEILLIPQIHQAPHTTITVVAIVLVYVMNSPDRANAIEAIYTMP